MGITVAPKPKEYPEHGIRWNRNDCLLLEKAGVLGYRYELIEGVVIRKMGQNLAHGTVIVNALLWLAGHFGGDYVRTQVTIDVSPEDNPTSEPEPDLVLLSQSANTILSQRPMPSNIRLCIEVSDTTLRYDLNTKAGLYARATIAEYWVISLSERRVYIHSQPHQGTYRVRTTHDESEIIAPLSAPEATVRVADLLPPPGAIIPEESDSGE